MKNNPLSLRRNFNEASNLKLKNKKLSSDEQERVAEFLDDVRINLRIRSWITIFFLPTFMVLGMVFKFKVHSFLYILFIVFIVLTFFYYYLFLIRKFFRTPDSLSAAIFFITSSDLIAVAILIFYVGAFTFGALLALPIYVIYAYLVLPSRWQRNGILLLAIFIFLATVFVEWFWIFEPARMIPLGPDMYHDPSFVATYIVSVVGLLFFIAYYSRVFSDKIRQKGSALRIQRNQLNAVFTHLPEGIMVFDGYGRLLFINPYIEKLLGIKRGRVTGKTIWELGGLSKRGQKIKRILDLWLEKKWSRPRKIKFQKPEKVLKMVGVEIEETPKEYFAASLVLFHDVTREEVISRMKSEFISIASHQLRTPLSAIKWVFDLLLKGDYGSLNEQQRMVIESGYRKNEGLIKMVAHLLDIARIEEGRFAYEFSLVDTELLMERVVNLYKKEAEERDIKVIFNRSSVKLPKLRMDEHAMRMVFENLLENAIFYNVKGGRVNISFETTPDSLRILFKDTGIGIPEEDLPRLFSKFYRAKNAVRLDTEGYGLGLYLIKNVIEAHKGKIEVSSVEGEETTFTVYLPLSKRQ